MILNRSYPPCLLRRSFNEHSWKVTTCASSARFVESRSRCQFWIAATLLTVRNYLKGLARPNHPSRLAECRWPACEAFQCLAHALKCKQRKPWTGHPRLTAANFIAVKIKIPAAILAARVNYRLLTWNWENPYVVPRPESVRRFPCFLHVCARFHKSLRPSAACKSHTGNRRGRLWAPDLVFLFTCCSMGSGKGRI